MFLVLLITSVDAQTSPDSLFLKISHTLGIIENQNYTNTPISSSNKLKCGLDLASRARNLRDKFTPAQSRVISLFLDRPQLQKSIISQSGFFRIHFDTIGINKPSYNLTDFANAADSALRFECGYLNFPKPLINALTPEDSVYDIYVTELGNLYGVTIPENKIATANNSDVYYSFIKVHNSFFGFHTQGINAAKVTIAHELHHAIQLSKYKMALKEGSISDLFFYELTSTSMEEFVFPGIEDYIIYLDSWFKEPSIRFNDATGYNLAHWNIFLRDRNGYSFLKRQWEFYLSFPALISITKSLLELGVSFNSEFFDFGIYCYFTGSKAISGKYFPSATKYPLITPTNIINFQNSSIRATLNSNPASFNYLSILNNSVSKDAISVIVANSGVDKAVNSPESIDSFTYTFSNSYLAGTNFLAYSYYDSFSNESAGTFTFQPVLNNQLITNRTQSLSPLTTAYPSPFVYSKYPQSKLYIPLESKFSTHVTLNIYSSSFALISSIETSSFFDKQNIIEWLPVDSSGQKLGSGVYFYLIKYGDSIQTGKFAIVN